MQTVAIGVALGLISTLGFATQQIINRRLVYQANVYRTTFLTLLGSVLVSVLVSPLFFDSVEAESQIGIALLWFALSGFVHFSLGWTWQGFSQRALGAARASPLTSSMVVFGALFATLFLGEPFNITLVAGIALTILGVILISREGMSRNGTVQNEWQGIVLGILAGVSWAISPILFRFGYAILPSTFVAVFTGLLAGAVIAFFIWQGNRRGNHDSPKADPALAVSARQFWVLQAAAGFVVATAVWSRWASLTFLPVVSVNALNLITIPIVVVLAPLILGKRLERTGWLLWLGTASMLLGVALTLVGGG